MASYGQFCPVSKAAEVLSPRWTLLIVRELLCGSVRFSEIQRGVPTCPPATLSKRLKELERTGVVERGATGWELTEAGQELMPIVGGMAEWGQRWSRSTYEAGDLDAGFLLWDLRRYLDPTGLGPTPKVVQIEIRSNVGREDFWIVVDNDTVDLCVIDPQRPVDVVVEADLSRLTEVWMGDRTMAAALDADEVRVLGPEALVARVPEWLGQHPVLAPISAATSALR